MHGGLGGCGRARGGTIESVAAGRGRVEIAQLTGLIDNMPRLGRPSNQGRLS